MTEKPVVQNADYYIEALGLLPHPEGGFYKEVYRSEEAIAREALPPRFSGDRAFSTSILYLLRQHDISALHAINQDEVWHFYAGSSVEIHVFSDRREYTRLVLGSGPGAGALFQAVVPAGSWFGAHLKSASDNNAFALVGCTVAPGFDFADFRLADTEDLKAKFPRHHEIIQRLSPGREME